MRQISNGINNRKNMLNLFREKCPTCKMALEKNKKCPESWGKKFCSESCREEYRKKMVNPVRNSEGQSPTSSLRDGQREISNEGKEQSHKSHCCCH